MEEMTLVRAVAGGLLVGAAAGLTVLVYGRVTGVTGMLLAVARRDPGEAGWRGLFLAGLAAGGGLLAAFDPEALPQGPVGSLPLVLAAGFLVGIGARLAGGCTSGHGLCGVGRLSRRSVAATGLFVLGGAAAVALSRALPGLR